MQLAPPAPRAHASPLVRFAPSLLLAAAVLAIYLMTYSGAITSADEASVLAATESVVKLGDLRTDQLIWAVWAHGWQAQGTLGPDGHVYSKKGFGLPYLLAPAVWLATAFAAVSKTHVAFLAGAFSTLGVVLLMAAIARRWGSSERVALALALITAFATPLWPYSRTLFQETHSAFALLLAVYAITGRVRLCDALLAGLAAGLGIAIRTTNALALAPLALYLLYRARSLPVSRKAALLVALGVPGCLALLTTGWLYWQRFGSPLITGYSSHETFSTPLWQGMYGMLLSPGKGLLFFAPVLLLVLLGLPASWRRRPAETALLLALVGSMLCLFSAWYDWGGGLAWGPRFALPVIPLLMPLMLPLLEGETRPFTRGLAWLLVALSTAIQLAAATTSYLETVPGSPCPVLAAFSRLAEAGPLGLDIAWLTATPEPAWMMLALFGAIAVIALAVLALLESPRWRARHGRTADSLARTLPLPLLVLLMAACVAGLLRIRADQRLPGGDDYRALAAGLAQAAQPSDTVLLDNHTRTEFFLGEDRSRAPRYDLLRSDVLSAPAAGLLARLAGRPGVLWLITDRPADAAVAKPEERWLDAHAYRWRETAFSPYARLIGYRVPDTADMQAAGQAARFDNGWGAEWRVEQPRYRGREGAGPAFEVVFQPGSGAAANVAASLQLVAAGGALAWQSDRALALSGAPVVLRGAAPLPGGSAGPYRLLLVLYDTQTGARAHPLEPGSASGQDSFEIGQVSAGR